MKKHSPQNTDEKRKLLSELMRGKVAPNDILKPITGVIYSHGGKVFAHSTQAGTISFQDGEEPNYEDYLASINDRCSHHVKFVDNS